MSYGVTIDPTRGRRGFKLVHGAQHSCKEFFSVSHLKTKTQSHQKLTQYHLITVNGADTHILPSGRPYATPQEASFEPTALIPKCNAPSPVKGGGDVNLSGAAQQTHTNTQYRQYTIQKQ